MTGEPERPFGGIEYPSLEQSRPWADNYGAIDYPSSYSGYPPGFPPYPRYPVGPYHPYRAAPPPGTNAKAIGSLVTALLGLVCCGLPSVAGIVLGVAAMRETRRTGQDGYAIALAGTIVGAFVTVIWMAVVVVWLLGMALALNGPAYT